MNIPKLLRQSAEHLNAGDAAAADVVLKRILKKQPKHIDALNLAGIAAYQQQQFDRARTLLTKVVQREPGRSGAQLNLGAVLNSLHDYAEADRRYRAVIANEPDNATALNNLGKNYLDQNKLGDAAEWLQAAIDADPTYWIARHNLGTCQQRQGNIDASIRTFGQVLEQQPNAETLSELISSLRRTNRFDDEYAYAIQLLDLPGAGDAAISAWETLFDACDWDTITRTMPQMLALLQAPTTRPAYRTSGLILLNSLPDLDPETTYACHRAWASSLEAPRSIGPRETRSGKTRIGYVSPDFRDHSVGFFMRDLIAAHSRERVEVYCYANSNVRDAVTDDIIANSTSYLDVSGFSDPELAERIANDGIDVLVDLAGHTRDSRVSVMNHRIAPVQVTYLGYPNTSGLDNVDYRISDPYADGDDGTRYSESLLRLPESFLCFGAFDTVPRSAQTPAAVNGYTTFGSFNNIRKINPKTVAAWSAVLHEVPDSKLVLKSRRTSEAITARNLYRMFATHDIGSDRITLLPATPSRRDHLAAYNNIDIVLDTFPYHGTTTTCEALWMGVPVLTLAGRTHAERVSYSILHNVGLDELVAWDADSFVALAKHLSRDTSALGALRAGLAERLQKSVLCDPERFTAQFEAALLGACNHSLNETDLAEAG